MSILLLAEVLYWIWILSELAILAFTLTRPGGGQVRDRGSLFLLWGALLLAGTLGARYGATNAPDIFPGAAWMRVAGLAVLVLGVAIRWTAVLTLGRAFSANVAIRAGQQLYTGGLYHRVRHPSYLGLLLILFAIGLHTHTWIGLGIVMIPSFAALSYRIEVEEAALRTAFGGAWESYSRGTQRLIPGIY